MSEELDVLKTVTGRLQTSKIPYMITGSIAANFYSVPRMTRDIDVVVEIMNEDVNRLVSLFEKDFYIERGAVEEAIAVRGMFNIIHNAYVLKVDFIVRKDSAFRELEFGRRRKIELEGVPMWIVSPEDLILSKLFWAKESSSEMQIKDVENLLRMVSDLDVSYIEHWVSSLGLEDIYQMARQ